MKDWRDQQVAECHILERLGEGRVGVTYQAFHRAEQTDVAFKVLADYLSQQGEVRAEFQKLATRLMMLEHPGIVRVIRHGLWRDQAFMITDFIAGPSLRPVLAQTSALAWADIFQLAQQVAGALVYAHEKDVYHLSLRPENVLLRKKSETPPGQRQAGYQAVLTDLGVSKLLEISLQQSGQSDLPQVLAYLSPEQCVATPVSSKTDVYALGAVLYELIAGQPPFRTPTARQAVAMHIKTTPKRVSQHRIDVPPDVEKLVMAMLAKTPRDRPEMVEVADKLQALGRQLGLEHGSSWEKLAGAVSAARRRPARREAEPSAPERAPQAASGLAELHISQPGRETRVVPLEHKKQIVIGRGSKCDVVLDDRRISRRHCEIRWEANQVTVRDLGGSNKTFLENTELIPLQPETLRPGTAIRIRPFTIRLVMPKQAPVEPSDGGPGAAPDRYVNVRFDREEVQVTPGGTHETLTVYLQNVTRIVDHFSLRVFGIPADWVTTPARPVQLNPRQEGSAVLSFHPPPEPTTTGGRHPIQVFVHSREQDKVVAQADAVLVVGPFSRYQAVLSPTQVETRTKAKLQVTLDNRGNIPSHYALAARDDSEALMFEIKPDEMELAPAASEAAQVRAAPRKLHLIGPKKIFNFTVSVTSSTAEPQVLQAQFRQRAWLPTWLPILLMFLCCALAALLAYFGPGAWGYLFPSPTPSATPRFTPTPTVTLTPTPSPTLTPTPDMTATWVVQDTDGDGLNNGEEINRGTDPYLADTDADRLNDGDEVHEYQTDPLDNDTDNDTWKDGEEVEESIRLHGPNSPILCPNPANPDSDADSITDRVDTDPCNLPPTVTPTITPVPSFGLGAHISTNDHFAEARQAGMTWIKTQIRYGPGDDPSAKAEDIRTWQGEGFKVLLGVVGHVEDVAQGPDYYAQYAAYVGGLAALGVDAIEIWNEPNIEREWPAGQISPDAYVSLLAKSSAEIRARGPGVLVISGALAPTGVDDGENVWADKRYIEGMAAAGADRFIDCVGLHYNEGIIAPSETSDDPRADDYYTRYFWGMVDTYWDAFGGALPLCFTELGYLSPEGYGELGEGFRWGQDTSEVEQTLWLTEAVALAYASGKVRLLIVWNLDFESYSLQDPQAGYAIIRPDGSCPACDELPGAIP